MSRTDDIVELLSPHLHIFVSIVLIAPISSYYPHFPFRLPLNVRQPVVRLNSSISYFILLLGLAFCRRHVWCRPYHLLFMRNNDIYSFRCLPNAIRSPLRTASSSLYALF